MQIRWLPKSLLATMLLLLAAGSPLKAFAQQHVSNPFVGATQYTNPDYTKEVQAVAATVSDPALKAQMNTVTTYSMGIWMDRIAAIAGNSAQSRQLGFTIAFAILLDTFFVRTLLVPSIAALLGGWNWWPSKLARPTSPPARI